MSENANRGESVADAPLSLWTWGACVSGRCVIDSAPAIPNVLHCGDNLDVLKTMTSSSIDLIYLDPPFSSNRVYSSTEPSGRTEAFKDVWKWNGEAEALYAGLTKGPVADTLAAMRRVLGDGDTLAYLTMMAPRILELHRVLKDTGSLFLHCDPIASHYLKLLLDAAFGPRNFRNEIVWPRTGAKSLMTRRLPSNHDVVLAYAKSGKTSWDADAMFVPYDAEALGEKTARKYRLRDPDGRRYQLTSLINPNPDRPNLTYEFLGVTRAWRWTPERMDRAYAAGLVVQPGVGRVPRLKRYLDEQRGRPLGDVWADVPTINARSAERLGFPTQKPMALMLRIIGMSSDPGGVVLDPFAGSGTSIDAAHVLGRRWVGIDRSPAAIGLIDVRLRRAYGEGIRDAYAVFGTSGGGAFGDAI